MIAGFVLSLHQECSRSSPSPSPFPSSPIATFIVISTTSSPPPPPPPPISLNSFEVVNGYELVPRFDSYVHLYRTTVGELISEVCVAVSVTSTIQRYNLRLNLFKTNQRRRKLAYTIGANGETVDLVIKISAPGHSSDSYHLSVHQIERSSIW